MSEKANLSTIETFLLWGRAAGRCEFDGCNKILHRDAYDLRPLNLADRAHITARSEGGPRGDTTRSPELADDIRNVMLLCKECHKRIDTNPGDFPEEMLIGMKSKHEARVELTTGFADNNKSYMITYAANVGHIRNPIDCQSAAMSMIRNGKSPAEPNAIDLSLIGSTLKDHQPEFWPIEEQNLVAKFNQKLIDRISDSGDIKHSSLFAIAPVPLLIKLGALFTDKCPVDIYQKKREPDTWDWLSDGPAVEFQISPPAQKFDKIALVLSLSGRIPPEDVHKTLGDEVSFWDVSIESPNNDCIKTPADLSEFRRVIRKVFDEVKRFHGTDQVIHTFAAIPISAAIEIGRTWTHRADLPLQTYNRDLDRIFQKAILIGKENTK